MRKMLSLSLLVTAIIAAPGAVQAQQVLPILSQPDPDSPIGERNPQAPDVLDQYAFVIGDWDADVTFYRPDGQQIRYMGKWHNIWIGNGLTVFQEWRGPYTTGIELRTYDPRAGHWTGQNYYPGPRGWWATTSHWNAETGEMTVRSTKPTPDGEALNEEIYYDITPDSFKMRSRMSMDGGETWERGAFSLTATRTK